jgi:hypothetical protein
VSSRLTASAALPIAAAVAAIVISGSEATTPSNTVPINAGPAPERSEMVRISRETCSREPDDSSAQCEDYEINRQRLLVWQVHLKRSFRNLVRTITSLTISTDARSSSWGGSRGPSFPHAFRIHA